MAANVVQKDAAIPLQDLPSGAISAIAFCPAQPQSGLELLAVASWDCSVRIYSVFLGPAPAPSFGTASGIDSQPGASIGNVTLYHGYSHNAPVLALSWSSDGTKLFSGGCDNVLSLCSVLDKSVTQLGEHSQPISAIVTIDQSIPKAIATGSWDKSIKYWNYESGQMLGQSPELPERVYSMDADAEHLVAATAERHIVYFSLQNPTQLASLPDMPDEMGGPAVPNPNPSYSPLSFQTRVLRCLPPGTNGNRTGYAIGSIEGRAGVHYNVRKSSKENFAFRCHRRERQPKPFSGPAPMDICAINDMAFNKTFGTVATLGSDGSFVFWDLANHTRLKEIQRFELNGISMDGIPMTSGSFNAQGTVFAYAFSYDWSKGVAGQTEPPPRGIGFYCPAPVDIKPRPKK